MAKEMQKKTNVVKVVKQPRKTVAKKVNKESGMSVINPEKLLTTALQKGLPVETIEKLLKMREDLKREWAREQYYFYLSKFQESCPKIKKDKKVYCKGKLRFSYAPLGKIVEQVKDKLKDCGFSYNLKTKQEKEQVTVICFAHHLAGHSEETEITMPIEKDAYMNEAQKVASAITYAKRYAFCNVFGIMTADEDIEDAKENFNEKKNEILIKAGKLKDHMTDKEKQHFYELNSSKEDYTENQYKLDLEFIQSKEKEIKND